MFCALNLIAFPQQSSVGCYITPFHTIVRDLNLGWICSVLFTCRSSSIYSQKTSGAWHSACRPSACVMIFTSCMESVSWNIPLTLAALSVWLGSCDQGCSWLTGMNFSVASQLNTALHILYVCLIYTPNSDQLVCRKLQETKLVLLDGRGWMFAED